jgi:RND family efflux transporter MFP subunit
MAVRAVSARNLAVDRAILVTGSLHPEETVAVSAEVAGRVKSVRFDFGQSVRAGDVVAEIDSTEYAIQLEKSKAALGQALARIGLDPTREPGKAPESTPALRQALAQAEDAKFKFESAGKLVKSGDISQERYTELEKTYGSRQAAVDAARDEMRTLWAQVDTLRAEVRLAEKRVRDCTLRAPFEGSVTERSAAPGQYIKENTPILTLVKPHPLRLRIEVPESAAGSVKIGDTLTFTTDAMPGDSFRAVVRQMNPSLDARNRSLTAEARIEGSHGRLRPGMFVQVRLVTARAVPVVAVPKEAIYTIAGLTKLFVLRDGKAYEQRVVAGEDLSGWLEVPADRVKAGDLVAVSQLGALVDGSPVEIRKGEKN